MHNLMVLFLYILLSLISCYSFNSEHIFLTIPLNSGLCSLPTSLSLTIGHLSGLQALCTHYLTVDFIPNFLFLSLYVCSLFMKLCFLFVGNEDYAHILIIIRPFYFNKLFSSCSCVSVCVVSLE